jgi:hypothetical protein
MKPGSMTGEAIIKKIEVYVLWAYPVFFIIKIFGVMSKMASKSYGPASGIDFSNFYG